jgi:hypothetical protein
MTDKYALVPRFRYTGEKYLLLWHTLWEQNQLLVADSEEQIISLWYAALNKEKLEAKPKELWKVNIVLPPTWVCESYARACYENDLLNFKHGIIFDIDDYQRKKHQLPPNVSKCQNYFSAHNEEEGDRDTHYNCLNCEDGLVFKIPIVKLFEREEAISYTPYRAKPLEPFDGLAADENKPLYVCCLNAGHHNSGITIDEISREKTLDASANVLFFFNGYKLQVPNEILTSREKLIQAKKKKEAEQKKQSEKRWAKAEKERYDKLLCILDPYNTIEHRQLLSVLKSKLT